VNVQHADAYVKTTFTLELNILILVALPTISDFHNLSIALKINICYHQFELVVSPVQISDINNSVLIRVIHANGSTINLI